MRAAIAAAVIGFLLLIGVYEYVFHVAERSVTFTVNDKAVLATGSNGNGHQYTIYTNRGTFRDGDNLWHGKFASSDLYGALRVGHRYTCQVTGYRVPLLSSYPNLIGCVNAAGHPLP